MFAILLQSAENCSLCLANCVAISRARTSNEAMGSVELLAPARPSPVEGRGHMMSQMAILANMDTECVHSIHFICGCFDFFNTTFRGSRARWFQVLRGIKNSFITIRQTCGFCRFHSRYLLPLSFPPRTHFALLLYFQHRRALQFAGSIVRNKECGTIATETVLTVYAPNLFDIFEDHVGVDAIFRDANVTELINYDFDGQCPDPIDVDDEHFRSEFVSPLLIAGERSKNRRASGLSIK